jgi:hypothetical protein
MLSRQASREIALGKSVPTKRCKTGPQKGLIPTRALFRDSLQGTQS